MKMTLCSDIQAVSVTLNLNTCGNNHTDLLMSHPPYEFEGVKFPNRDPCTVAICNNHRTL